MAWDARAARLAVALGGGHPAAGCVALFDTRCDPIVSARFVGFLRLGPLAGGGGSGEGGSRAAAALEGWEEIQPEEVAEAAGAVGGARPAAAAAAPAAQRGSGGAAHSEAGQAPQLAFLPRFAQGAVLAVRRGSRVAAVPMYFA